jgi:hypothetical protein
LKKSNLYYVDYSNVNRITISTPVKYLGYQVGFVSEVTPDLDKGLIRLTLDLDENMALPKGSMANILTETFMGGASIILNFNKKELVKNVDVTSNLTLFNNYTDSRKENRKNIDVMWNWNILMKVSKYITTSIIGQMVYDDDILVPRKTEAFKDANGIVSYKTTSGKGIQLKNILGVGFTYKF